LIKQYKKIFKTEGITLKVEEDALEYIVEKALELKLGARGLRSICEALMNEAMFELPSEKGVKEFVLNREYAERQFEHKHILKLKAA